MNDTSDTIMSIVEGAAIGWLIYDTTGAAIGALLACIAVQIVRARRRGRKS